MQIKVPRLVFFPQSYPGASAASIKVADDMVHQIENPDEFYGRLGYTQEAAKAGKLPDEFIWEEYVKDASPRIQSCFQVRMIEYLITYSNAFREKYGARYAYWIAAHAATIAAAETGCFAGE